MAIRIKTEYGLVSYGMPLFYKTIDNAMAPYKGRIFAAHYKGHYMDAVVAAKSFYLIAEKHVSASSDGVLIRVYVMTRFGVPISAMVTDIIERIAADMKSLFELPIDDIEFIVTGVVSKRVAKRNIVIKYSDILKGKKAFW